LKHPPKFFLWDRRGKEMIVAEGYCWAITLAAGRACCGWLCSRVLESGFQLSSLTY